MAHYYNSGGAFGTGIAFFCAKEKVMQGDKL